MTPPLELHCPVRGCCRVIRAQYDVMCAWHWNVVPRALKETVRCTYQLWCDRKSQPEAWHKAVDATIASAGRRLTLRDALLDSLRELEPDFTTSEDGSSAVFLTLADRIETLTEDSGPDPIPEAMGD